MYIKTAEGDFYKVTEISIKDEQTFVAVKPAEGGQENVYTVPESALVGDTEDAVGAWLVSETGNFASGTVLTTAEYNLLIAQTAKLAEIKARRIELEEGGLPTSFGVVDSDPDSQRKISGGVQMALISLNSANTVPIDTDGDGVTEDVPFGAAFFPEGLDIVWRFSDNTTAPLTAEKMVQMGVEVGKQVAQCQMVKNYFDAQVAAATTVAEVEAIDAQVDWFALDLTPQT